MGTLKLTLVALVAIFAGHQLVHGIKPPSLTLSTSRAKQGDNVTVTCIVDTEGEDLELIYGKKLGGDNQQTISLNTKVLEPYKTRGKYHVEKIMEGNQATVTLYMTDVTKEDSGEIACLVIEGGEAARTLQVIDGIDEVMLEMNETFKEGIGQNVSCTIVGSIPAPTGKLHVEGHDYTQYFMQHHLDFLRNEGASKPMYIEYGVTYFSDNFMPRAEDDGRIFTCEGHLPDYLHIPVVSNSTTLDIIHLPKFNCSDKVSAELHDKNKVISCVVSTNPPGGEVYWTFKWGQENVKLEPGHSTPDKEITASVHAVDKFPNKQDVRLTIATVMERHFDPTYTLVAKYKKKKVPTATLR